MGPLTREMEVRLGPDTTKLGFRVGLHSGPVTAGVLRGEKSRFQLFGDTVNMVRSIVSIRGRSSNGRSLICSLNFLLSLMMKASRMESTGKRDYIQLSNSTANLLMKSGKDHWITKREDVVQAKGKGTVQTFWVRDMASQRIQKDDSSTGDSSDTHMKSSDTVFSSDQGSSELTKKIRRPLIKWQVELLSRQIKQIVAKRSDNPGISRQPFNVWDSVYTMPRDEIVDELKLSSCKPSTSQSTHEVDLPDEVHDQLDDFVTSIAMLYRDNVFHNYEHACHVTMSANKFLTRVVNPEVNGLEDTSHRGPAHGNEYAYGLTGCPLTQFAIIFSALIHDIDHQGVSNKQLSDENNRIATMYNGKSAAEQNSIDLAFEVLGSSQYRDLVSCICVDEDEVKRFRQLVVNCVMATDM